MQFEPKSTHAALTAIPGSSDFYIVYTEDMKRMWGRRYSGGYATVSSQTIPGIMILADQTTYGDFAITANPPAPVSSFAVSPSDGLSRLYWTNPTSGNFYATMIRFKTTGYPTGPTDGTLVCDRYRLMSVTW